MDHLCMNSIVEASSSYDDRSQASTPTITSPPTSTTPPASMSQSIADLSNAGTEMNPTSKRDTKSYGSLTEELHRVKSFIKKTLKEDKVDRLERKELDKVAIAKMRLGVDEYDELLGTLQKKSGISKLGGDGDGKGVGGDGTAEVVGEGVSNMEMDRIQSLRRQLASMRKRS